MYAVIYINFSVMNSLIVIVEMVRSAPGYDATAARRATEDDDDDIDILAAVQRSIKTLLNYISPFISHPRAMKYIIELSAPLFPQ